MIDLLKSGSSAVSLFIVRFHGSEGRKAPKGRASLGWRKTGARRTMCLCMTPQVIPCPVTTGVSGRSRYNCPGGTGGARTPRAPSAARDGGNRWPWPGRLHPHRIAVRPSCRGHWRPRPTWLPRCLPKSWSRAPGGCCNAGTAGVWSRPSCDGSRSLPAGNSPAQAGYRESRVPDVPDLAVVLATHRPETRSYRQPATTPAGTASSFGSKNASAPGGRVAWQAVIL